MNDRIKSELSELLGASYRQEQEYIRLLSQNRREGERFPRAFSLSYLEGEKRALQAGLTNTNALTTQIRNIIEEVNHA